MNCSDCMHWGGSIEGTTSGLCNHPVYKGAPVRERERIDICLHHEYEVKKSTANTKPPLGVMPRFLFLEHRISELAAAIKRHGDGGPNCSYNYPQQYCWALEIVARLEELISDEHEEKDNGRKNPLPC